MTFELISGFFMISNQREVLSMNKEMIERYMAKMNGEQCAELLMMMDIIDQSEPESKICYKGRTYYTFIL